jgi:hypothetical protein
MGIKFPQYRVSQWIDTSDEAINATQATIIYGVQTKREKGGAWMHVAKGTEPMFFDSADKASEAIKELRASEAVVVA